MTVTGADRPTRRSAHAAKPARRTRRVHPTTRTLLILLGPFVVGFMIFTVVPFAIAVGKSFTRPNRESPFGPATDVFAGLFNYTTALSDDAFLTSFRTVLLYGLVQIPVMLVGALVLALLLDSVTARFKRTFRLIYFLPYAVPGVVAAIMWLFLYAPSSSPINQVLEPLGLEPNLLSENVVLLVLANVNTWVFTGYNMLIVYSALQAIPESLYEAARLDGASGFSIARHIKIPNVMPSILLTAVMSVIGTGQLFSEPLTLKNQITAITADYTPIMAAYRQISAQNYGLGAAMSVIITVLIGALSIAVFRLTRNRVSL
ncbi:sugar ABC transporter permease [Actinomycetes bacterium KLBMP 9759]